MRKKRFLVAIPIAMGVAGAILWRTFIPENLTVEVYQWVYSTIVQAFAAMVAVVGMFAIYKLQLLRHNLETEAERLRDAVAELNMTYLDGYTKVIPEGGLTVSDDFVGDKRAFRNLGEEIRRGTKHILDRQKKIKEKAKTVPTKDKQEEWEKQQNVDKLEHIHLARIRKRMNPMNRPYERIETGKKSVMEMTKAVKMPLAISGVLIGTSLFLLSLSDKDIITKAPSVFLWLLAVVIGTTVCLTYMLIREIIILVET